MNGSFSVAFGIRRGKCTRGACKNICSFYKFGPGDEGGLCTACGHFSAAHENLGNVLLDPLPSSPSETPAPPDPSSSSSSSSNGHAEPSVPADPITYDVFDPNGVLNDGEEGAGGEVEPMEDFADDLADWSIQGNEIQILSKLGSGKSALVCMGLYKGIKVAIKVLKATIDKKELKNFNSEIDILKHANSPNVIRFYGGCLKPKICLVMELCENGSLYHLLQKKELNITWDMSLRFAIETISGIAALHSLDPPVVHRDLKTLNLLVDGDYVVKVCDFGLSRITAESSDDSTLGKLRGTYAYTAPEVYFGEKYTEKSDVFSFSVVLWELVTRTLRKEYIRPYTEFNYKIDFQVIIGSAKKGNRPTIDDRCPEVLSSIMKTCWGRQPADRPTAPELLQQLIQVREQYLANRDQWDSLLLPAGSASTSSLPIPSSSSSSSLASLNSASSSPSVLSSAVSHSTPEASSSSSSTTSTPAAAEASSEDEDKKTKRPGLKRSLSGRMLGALTKKADSQTSEEKKIVSGPVSIGPAQWTHRGADALLNDPSISQPAAAAPAPSADAPSDVKWKHLNKEEWRDEDSFDDDKKKDKKSKGLLSIFKRKH
eukprot:TRINITY_DN4879_c0_g2_i2.p1 TRINITY_DN4879_c0_g2~~TRINITY_DN4879_c0_g2_i2.p1  ORF type:complete len:599 (+),score=237.74 TRINITY_DN4879_c0_g2_i2:394-2190(+)